MVGRVSLTTWKLMDSGHLTHQGSPEVMVAVGRGLEEVYIG